MKRKTQNDYIIWILYYTTINIAKQGDVNLAPNFTRLLPIGDSYDILVKTTSVHLIMWRYANDCQPTI